MSDEPDTDAMMDLTSLSDSDLDPETKEELMEDRGGHDVDPDTQTGYELSENVVRDLVKYVRSNTIRNEQQFILGTLGYTTGYFTVIDHYVSGMLIGTSSSGKTHLQNQIENLFRSDDMYQATMGTDKSLIYDGEWDEAYIASLDELNKPSDTLIEFLKSCFTPDTDVLTPDGIRNIRDLDVGDDVYSINPDTEALEVKQVTDVIEKPDYSGELIDFDGDNTSLRMTPDHELLRHKGDELVTQTADELAEMASFRLPTHTARDGPGVSDIVDLKQVYDGDCPVVTDTDGTEYLTAGPANSWVPRYIDRDDWIELLAWYITEGYARQDGSPQVTIAQNDASEIAALVDGIGIDNCRYQSERRRDSVTITNDILRDIVTDICGHKSQQKQLPDWVFDMSVERKELLLETLMKGDGSDDGYTYYTTSEQLKDDVVQLVLECGRMPSYRDQAHVAPNSEHYWTISVTDNNQWVTKKHNIERTHSSSVDTDGVYCVTVEDNHTLVAGRNGKFSHARNCHSDDEQFQYKLTPDSAEKREAEEVETITRDAKPYWFLFAQMDADFEMMNRLMRIPVHESESKNRAVGRMSFDEHHINLGDANHEYGFDFEDGERALQAHIASIPEAIESGEIPGRVFIPNDEGRFGWKVWNVMEPIFNHSRSESNRVYDMVANIVRASAMLNYKNRDIEYLDIPNHDAGRYIIAEPQDVANVLACRESLLASTHELDDKKRKICSAIANNTGQTNEADMSTIVDGLQDSDMSMLSRPELRKNLEKLHENYLVEIHRNAAENGSSDTYQFHGWGELGFSNIYQYEDRFEHCFDPISDENFIVSYEEQRKRLEDTGQDLTKGAELDISSNTGSSNSQQKLTGGSTTSVDLEPHEEAVRKRCKASLDGKRVENISDVPIEAMLGLTDPNDPDRGSIEIDGTPLDPTNGIWYRPDKDDDWVEDEADARRHVKQAVRSLVEKRVLIYDEVHEVNKSGEPVDVTFAVLSKTDL